VVALLQCVLTLGSTDMLNLRLITNSWNAVGLLIQGDVIFVEAPQRGKPFVSNIVTKQVDFGGSLAYHVMWT
jgi:hypothetical protein